MSSALFSPSSSPHPAPLPLPSSSLPHCPELDLSVTLSPAHKTGGACCEPRPLRECEQDKLRPRGQTDRSANRKVHFQEPVVAMETAEPCFPLPHRQPIRSQRRRGHGRESRGRASGQRAEPPAAAATEEPACLQGAQLNTTLALKAELESLEGAEFNAQRAVEETLQKSTRAKNLISSRASEGVNVSHSQLLFTSLVSVDVQKDQLISQVLQDRLLLAPPPRISGHKFSDAPSVLAFLTSDLYRQKPLPPDDDDPISSRPILTPTPRPAYSTFDLYRQRVRWEATD